jgi:(p)ppGpp synthase/HD superfamily hydrolase
VRSRVVMVLDEPDTQGQCSTLVWEVLRALAEEERTEPQCAVEAFTVTTTATIADAVALAARAHRDHRDKAGQPYILHPLRVMLRQHNEAAQIVAVLHDVLEDSEVTVDDLRRDGYTDEVITALEALTKREDESYDEFIERVAVNSLARRVKLADLEDNMNVHRLTKVSSEDLERITKYHTAWRRLARLEGMLPEPEAA